MRTDNVFPLGNRVLVEKVVDEKTEGGIYIPMNIEDADFIKVKVLRSSDKEEISRLFIIGKYSGLPIERNLDVRLVNRDDLLAEIIE